MRRLLLIFACVALLIPLSIPQRASAQGLCLRGWPTNWATFGEFVWLNDPLIPETNPLKRMLRGSLTSSGGQDVILASASYSVETWHGLRGIRSISISWLHSGMPDISAIAETAIYLQRRNQVRDAWSTISAPNTGWMQHTVYFPDIVIDTITIVSRLPTSNFLWTLGFIVDEVCFYPANVDASPTPLFTNTPTVTASVTTSPTHTMTPTETPTGTLPTPSDTPVITATSPPLDLPTMDSGGFRTPLPPDQECADIREGCVLWPVPRPPTIVLPSPTILPPQNTLTPIATYTFIPTSSGPDDSSDMLPPALATNLAGGLGMGATRIVLGADGDPADIRNAGHEIGANIGSLWAFVRMLQGVDLGRVGQILAFLILLIAFNLMIRFLLFIIPIVFAFFRLLLQIGQAVTGLIDAIIPF